MANIRDANGEYLFSGYRGTTQPFLRGADGSVTYAGDQGQRLAQIGASRTVATGDAGDAVFTGIRAGNGHFTALADPANTGTGVILPGAVVDMNQWLAGRDQYRIAFVTNAAGNWPIRLPAATAVSWCRRRPRSLPTRRRPGRPAPIFSSKECRCASRGSPQWAINSRSRRAVRETFSP